MKDGGRVGDKLRGLEPTRLVRISVRDGRGVRARAALGGGEDGGREPRELTVLGLETTKEGARGERGRRRRCVSAYMAQ